MVHFIATNPLFSETILSLLFKLSLIRATAIFRRRAFFCPQLKQALSAVVYPLGHLINADQIFISLVIKTVFHKCGIQKTFTARRSEDEMANFDGSLLKRH